MNSVISNISKQFIRHPSDIPIEYTIRCTPKEYANNSVKDVSTGGLSFYSKHFIQTKQWLHLYIPVSKDYFEADAQVRWCKLLDTQNLYHIGVSFTSDNEAYSARMIEQVCHIEHYKKEVMTNEGRRLSSDEAAAEWITKFATDFPQTNS